MQLKLENLKWEVPATRFTPFQVPTLGSSGRGKRSCLPQNVISALVALKERNFPAEDPVNPTSHSLWLPDWEQQGSSSFAQQEIPSGAGGDIKPAPNKE